MQKKRIKNPFMFAGIYVVFYLCGCIYFQADPTWIEAVIAFFIGMVGYGVILSFEGIRIIRENSKKAKIQQHLEEDVSLLELQKLSRTLECFNIENTLHESINDYIQRQKTLGSAEWNEDNDE